MLVHDPIDEPCAVATADSVRPEAIERLVSTIADPLLKGLDDLRLFASVIGRQVRANRETAHTAFDVTQALSPSPIPSCRPGNEILLRLSGRSATRDHRGQFIGAHPHLLGGVGKPSGARRDHRRKAGMSLTKVQSTHCDRLAYVYVRQSTPIQVLENRESTERQYQLQTRAVALGWPPNRVEVIDEDQGRTGSTAAHRTGFQRLVSEVGLGRVGIVLMLEASRLARNNSDWYRLIEICGISATLIADEAPSTILVTQTIAYC
jgi:hypothetical protein